MQLKELQNKYNNQQSKNLCCCIEGWWTFWPTLVHVNIGVTQHMSHGCNSFVTYEKWEHGKELNYYECYNILHQIQINYCHFKGEMKAKKKKKLSSKILIAFISSLCKRFIDSTFGAAKTLCSSSGQLNVCNCSHSFLSSYIVCSFAQSFLIMGKYIGKLQDTC